MVKRSRTVITNIMSDNAILNELGQRIMRYRLNKNMTQQELAHLAGVSRPTIQRAEKGESIQATKLIRILRSFNLVENLNIVFPEPLTSPMQQVKMHGKIRKRASSKQPKANKEWSWGDKE